MHFVDQNSVLKLKFQILQATVVNSVNAADIIDFLFSKGVLGPQHTRTVQLQKSDPQQQCRHLLALLHTSEHPQTFVQLYRAVKNEGKHLQWLVDRIDEYSDQSVVDLLKPLYISERKGKRYINPAMTVN